MKELIHRICNHHIIRYLFFGCCATLHNLVWFWLLRSLTPLSVDTANTISILLTIVFAYFTNSRFVFHSYVRGMKEHMREFMKFFGSRITTMILEIAGVSLFVHVLHGNEYASKIIMQFIVFVTNYVLSKLFVFRTTERSVKNVH